MPRRGEAWFGTYRTTSFETLWANLPYDDRVRRPMNIRKQHLYSPLIALLLVGCVAGERRTVHIARTFDATSIKRIELREVNGEIHVDAVSPNSVSLDAEVRSWGHPPDPSKENQGYFEPKLEGNTLVIGRQQMHPFPWFHTDPLDRDYNL